MRAALHHFRIATALAVAVLATGCVTTKGETLYIPGISEALEQFAYRTVLQFPTTIGDRRGVIRQTADRSFYDIKPAGEYFGEKLEGIRVLDRVDTYRGDRYTVLLVRGISDTCRYDNRILEIDALGMRSYRVGSCDSWYEIKQRRSDFMVYETGVADPRIYSYVPGRELTGGTRYSEIVAETERRQQAERPTIIDSRATERTERRRTQPSTATRQPQPTEDRSVTPSAPPPARPRLDNPDSIAVPKSVPESAAPDKVIWKIDTSATGKPAGSGS